MDTDDHLVMRGVILSAAVFQKERMISTLTGRLARRIFAPLVKARGFGMTPQ